jgi:hypothetical protein
MRTDDPAFPTASLAPGLSVRQYVGLQMMAALLSDPSVDGDPNETALVAAEYTDAYLKRFLNE